MSRSTWPFLAVAVVFFTAWSANAGERISAEKELRQLERGEHVMPHIGGAKSRVAVFDYDDPDRTGVGTSLSALMATRILTSDRMESLGVLRYEGNLAPDKPGGDSYFDKVDRLVSEQDVALALWGHVRRTAGAIVVDTYLQMPAKEVERAYSLRLRLPERNGRGVLRASLRPDRILLQRRHLSPDDVRELQRIAAQIDTLRAEPSLNAAVVRTIPQNEVYSIERIQGDWALVQPSRGGPHGWILARQPCSASCTELLAPSELVASLVRDRTRPEARKDMSTDALAAIEQIRALSDLGSVRVAGEPTALELSERWVGPHRLTGPDPALGIDRGGGGVPPGGAAFANIHAIARVVAELERRLADIGSHTYHPLAANERYDELELPPEFLRDVAYDLAEASLDDPRNVDVLENLAILFKAAGEPARADLADRLAKSAR